MLKIILIILLILILFIVISCFFGFRKNYENFNNTTPKISLFYTPSCPHCVEFIPVWDEFTEKMKPYVDSKKIIIEKTNCATDSQTCLLNDISFYPTIKLFIGDEKKIIFNDERNIENLISFVKKNTNLT